MDCKIIESMSSHLHSGKVFYVGEVGHHPCSLNGRPSQVPMHQNISLV